MSKFYNLLIFVSFCLFSCNIITFEEINLSSNINDEQLYFNDEFLKLSFSIEPNQDSVEKIVILKEDSSRINAEYKWVDNNLFIKPKSSWNKNAYYDFSLAGNIQTFDNKNYQVDFKRSFYYGQPGDIFSINSIIMPTKNDKTKKDIILTFNREINIFEFEKKFSIRPYTKITKEYFNDNKSVKISPEVNWQTNTLFEWTLEQFNSADNVKLDKNYSDNFIGIEDLQIPQLVDIHAATITNLLQEEYKIFDISKIKIDDSIAFIFNKSIDLTSFENNFNIQPKVQGHFIKDENTIIFIPSEKFKINQEYVLKLNKNLKDTNSLSLFEDFRFVFTPSTNFLFIQNLKMNKSTDIELFKELNKITTPTAIDISSTNKLFVQITFSNNIKKNHLQNIEKVVALETFFPTSLSYPKLEKIEWLSDKDVVLQYSNLETSQSEDYLYRFNINAINLDFCSIDNEYLEESQCVIFTAK